MFRQRAQDYFTEGTQLTNKYNQLEQNYNQLQTQANVMHTQLSHWVADLENQNAQMCSIDQKDNGQYWVTANS